MCHGKLNQGYRYSAVTSPTGARRAALREHVRVFFGGSVEQLMTTLLRQESWTDAELDALRAEIDRVRRERKARSPHRRPACMTESNADGRGRPSCSRTDALPYLVKARRQATSVGRYGLTREPHTWNAHDLKGREQAAGRGPWNGHREQATAQRDAIKSP